MQKGTIIVRIWEGLGNQMFQYAYARALRDRGFDVRLDLDKVYDEAFIKNKKYDLRQNSIQEFNITLRGINVEEYGKYRYIKRDNFKNRVIFWFAKHGLWKYKFYEAKEHQYSRKTDGIRGNCYVKGWFQDERYFKTIQKELRKELTPKKKIKISQELRKALEYDESVSVHIRRGDYVKVRHALKMEYYRKAAAWIKEQYRNPQFLIFSDDLDWVKENLGIGNNCIYINEDRKLQDYEELMIMSRCKSNIISNSTFSWWGAWLNPDPEKIIIAPRNCWLPRQKNMILL